MKDTNALQALSALSQRTRLNVFRLLIEYEPTGRSAGQIALELDVTANTLSTHLAILERAKLVTSQRQGRSIIYRADIGCLRDLMIFLAKDCCAGRADLCGALAQELALC